MRRGVAAILAAVALAAVGSVPLASATELPAASGEPVPPAVPVPPVTTTETGAPAPASGTREPAAASRPPLPAMIPAGLPTTQTMIAPAEGEVVRLPVGHARILEMPIPVRDVVVANGVVADVSIRRRDQVFVVGKTVGQTNVFFMDRAGQVIRRLEVQVNLDAGTLNDTLRRLLPDERIRAESIGGTLFLSGSVRSAGAVANATQVARRFVPDAANVVNLLKVADEQQVLLRVRVAEVQRTALKELGLYTWLRNFGSLNLTDIAPFSGAGLTSTNVAGSWLQANGRLATKYEFMVRALEKDGLIKTLAEPNLTAISGETAKMLAGGEYPVPVAQKDGNVTIEFKPFGVALGFTPVVVGEGRISLKLASEVSAIDKTFEVGVGTITVYGLKVRRAETSVELPSGGTLMIAGLIQNDSLNNVDGLPYLKDVPILGQLFRSESFQRNESELVVMVTAMIVKPVDGNRLAVPTDGFSPGSDLDVYLLGRLQHVYNGGAGPPPAEAVQGPVGYIMD